MQQTTFSLDVVGRYFCNTLPEAVNDAGLAFDVADAVSSDPDAPRERVWGAPWRSNQAMPGLTYCVGERSLYWGGWAPRLTAADQALWPVIT